MGYGYAVSDSGRYALACDGGCGRAGSAQSVRKRPCPHKVSHDGFKLPYCPAPALCSACYKRHGGLRGVHGENCREGAAASQAREDAKQAKLASGEKEVKAAWGSWQSNVPDGKVGIVVRAADGQESYHLVPAEQYNSGGWLSDYDNEPWSGPSGNAPVR